ncbi:DMT family transporter [Thermoleptolyngbya sp. C42_A2020_037]|uniref:DMT family transporter n=1 Tax=Thermoleptolyngbya sp. C42_A2020_037 TaxID=2747799 RepID=UPI0019F187FF|nr:DMT family transporter [Thermoleptolyngbya sp. C42_A2020_037]MBF2084704.1 DMT family transporter [Thermoleptolyngbya sp. C42_A2020_037]
MGLTAFRGELAALAAALIWAIASIAFTKLGRRLSPMALNLSKGLISIGLILLTLGLSGSGLPAVSGSAVWLLGLSGAIGIGLGDTAYFASLNSIGARRGLLLESLAPPLTALLALVFLQERLSGAAWLGIGLTVGGVAWVIVERSPDLAIGHYRPLRGLAFGLIAALSQASGAVLSRAALSTTDISPLWGTLIRLVAGLLVLLLWLAWRPPQFVSVGKEVGQLRSPRFLGIVAATAFASTFLGIWLQQTALKFAPAGIAQSLLATSPLFVIPIAVALGDRASFRAVLGVLVAIAGIWLLFWRG